MMESVSVAVRFRPLTPAEQTDDQGRLSLKVAKTGPVEMWSLQPERGLVLNTRTGVTYPFGSA